MRTVVSLVSSLLLVSSAAHAANGRRIFMPENDLHLHKQLAGGGISEKQFNAVIDRAEAIYKPIFAEFGATLKVERLWNDETVNAYADQVSATDWQVHMFGGLARRAEVTEDGFAMVLCHELGHHLGGYPYVEDWAADEGQADMHATGACAAKIFATNLELSARAQAELPADMKAKCDSNRPEGERDLCYRSLLASKSLADLLASLEGSKVSFDTPDTSKVSKTNHKHPAAQCRLDTYVASSLCGSEKWDYKVIPGKTAAKRNSLEAQAEAYKHSCTEGDGARPHCWFAELTEDPAPTEDCPLGDQATCDLFCQYDPTLPWCEN